jgi:FkbM family methyltransferase
MKRDEVSFYSQFGEDELLFKIFQEKSNGFCIEVGANNGIDDSTSLFFEKLGWKCILVEPNPVLCRQLRDVRHALIYECAVSNENTTVTLHVVEGTPRSHGMSTISTDAIVHERIKKHGFVSVPVRVQTMTLNQILDDARVDAGIDFVSIDVEGHELEVLRGFSIEKWRPTIMLIEDNSNFVNTAVGDYLKRFGYVKFKRTGVNDWYAHRSNKQLVTLRNRIAVRSVVFMTRSKDALRRVPFILKTVRSLRTRVGR